jgi:trk system potassium uptake protein TrkA
MRQFVVMGLGNFGYNVATTLAEKGCQVLAIDADKEKVQHIKDSVAHVVCADVTDKETFFALGLEDIDVAVVSLGAKMEASVLAALYLKEIGVKQIIVKAISEDHAKILESVGATEVVFPEKEMGIRVANRLIMPNVQDHIQLTKGHSIVELLAPNSFYGKTLLELDLGKKYGVQVIAIKRHQESGIGNSTDTGSTKIAPIGSDKIQPRDVLVVVGANEAIGKLQKVS